MSIKNKKSKSKSNKNRLMLGRILIITAVVLVAAVAAVFAYNRFYANSKANYVDSTSSINYDPPTTEERQAGDNKKEEITKEQESPAPAAPAGTATVVLTYAGVYNDALEVGAYISNIIEEGGTCKLTLTHAGKTVTTTTKAVSNARTSDCPTLSVKKSQLTSGVWSAVVTYTSSKASGSSAAKDITVQ